VNGSKTQWPAVAIRFPAPLVTTVPEQEKSPPPWVKKIRPWVRFG
jgi:hypothetical protein